jgi:hypothetical protein
MSARRTDNHGSLSRNKRKEKSTHPTHKGSCTIHGVQYWISAYVNENRETGEKYFKLYFEAKQQSEEAPAPAAAPAASLEDSPDIPF